MSELVGWGPVTVVDRPLSGCCPLQNCRVHGPDLWIPGASEPAGWIGQAVRWTIGRSFLIWELSRRQGFPRIASISVAAPQVVPGFGSSLAPHRLMCSVIVELGVGVDQ